MISNLKVSWIDSDICSVATVQKGESFHESLSLYAHQRSLTQQLTASDQVAYGDVKVGVATAPVGDLSEGVGGQDILDNV